MRFRTLLLGMFLMTVSLTGGASTDDIVTANRTYDAYGKTWRYVETRHDTTEWGFNTPHGLMGKIEKVRQTAYLSTNDGEKIPVHERIFALQKDGSYKQAKCCSNFGNFLEIYQIDGKLVLGFEQTQENVTDCWVYPPNMPSNYRRKENEIYRVEFYGDFNPASKRFEIQDFVAKRASYEEIHEKFGKRPNRTQEIELNYRKRTLFKCDEK